MRSRRGKRPLSPGWAQLTCGLLRTLRAETAYWDGWVAKGRFARADLDLPIAPIRHARYSIERLEVQAFGSIAGRSKNSECDSANY